MPFNKLNKYTLTTYQRTRMNIMNFFKDKCMIASDNASTITNLMQGLPKVSALQQANTEKLEKAKEMLGSNWILHKDNAVTRKDI